MARTKEVRHLATVLAVFAQPQRNSKSWPKTPGTNLGSLLAMRSTCPRDAIGNPAPRRALR